MRAENRVFANANQFGLRVRDYVAIQAMTGLLAGGYPLDGVPARAYEIADAMIKESEVRDKACSPQMIAEASCDGDISKCKGACYK